MHVRQRIRTDIVALLGPLPATAGNVLVGRTRPLPKDHPDTLLVYTIGATPRPFSTDYPPTVINAVRVIIEARVLASEPPDDKLDQISAEVETVMPSLKKLGGYITGISPPTVTIRITAEGDTHSGSLALEYVVTYSAKMNAPETAQRA